MSQRNKIELLSPAKNASFGISAVNCGADAVYIGADKFGARKNASNSLSEIETLVNYAHIYRSRVYAAVNTVIYDSEIDDAVKLIWRLFDAGIDGIIIQDMGILECALPPVKLIASTQAENSSPQKVKFFEDCGFSRVVLARELSLAEIAEIRKNTEVELESFVHGAVCVSFSGNCWMSCAAGGRSANRGECAQPCRNLYSLYDENGKLISGEKHLLSLKDINRSDCISQMIEAGISSFKIEGRLKDESYVKNITSYYRKKIDAVLENKHLRKSSSGKTIASFDADSEKSFNRGFSDYFLNGRKKEITSFDSPKSCGHLCGKILLCGKDYLEVTGEYVCGDGISFFMEDGSLSGGYVNAVEGKRIKLNRDDLFGARNGSEVYKNYDKKFEDSISSRPCVRKVGIAIHAQTTAENDNVSIVFRIADEDGIEVEFSCPEKFALADNPDSALKSLSESMKKLGDTEFYCGEVLVNGPVPFAPKSALNSLRRDLTEKLRTERSRMYSCERKEIVPTSHPYIKSEADYSENVCNAKAKAFYERHGCVVSEFGAERGIDMSGKVLMRTKHCLKYSFGLCGSSEKLYLTDSRGQKYDLDFDCDKCEMLIRKTF